MTPLVRTPAPIATESLWGYILRVSEENGYSTPNYVLGHAGITEAERNTATFDPAKLAAVVNKTSEDLAHLSYFGPINDGRPSLQLLGKPLGSSTRRQLLRLQSPAFCPQCVAADGYLDAIWDLALLTACPKHQCELLHNCPACKAPISWLRPGLLTCKCTKDLAGVATEPVSSVVAELMDVLATKAHGRSILDLPNTSGLPLAELEPLSLHVICQMMVALAENDPDLSSTSLIFSSMPIVKSSAAVLEEWPQGYHRFLKRIGSTTEATAKKAAGLTVRFEQFYSSMFKSRACSADLEFLRQEFVRFGCIAWGGNTVDPRFHFPDAEPRWVSLASLASHLSINVVTLKKWIEQDVIPVQKVGTRYIIDRTQAPSSPRARDSIMSCTEAAKLLGLPKPVLQDLKHTGYFLGPQTPSIATGYTEQEVCNFSERLLQQTTLVEDIAPSSPNAMAFTDIMRHLKFGSDRSKAQFVKDYLDGKIKALGRWGDSIDSIFFSLKEAHDFAWRCRLNASRQDYCSLADAARLIGCDAKAVPGLVKVGLLRSKPKQKTYICRKSICEFSESWVALCSIAQSVSTTSKRLEKLADQANIERLVIAPVYQKAEPSSFIRKEGQDRLLAEHKAHPARKRRATLIKLMADGLS